MTAPERTVRPVLVFAVCRVPVRARSGSPIRSHRLVSGLAERFEVVLVAPRRELGVAEPPPGDEEIRRDLPGVEVVTVPARRGGKRARQLISLASRHSSQFGQVGTRQLRATVHEVARRRNAAIVHFDDPGAASAGPVQGVINTFAPHNVEHEILAGAVEHSTGARRAFSALEARKVRREELAQWNWADMCIAVSDLDAQSMVKGGARDVLVVPNGTDSVSRAPAPRRAPGEPLRLFFVGADYLPNRIGLEWLIGEVLPAARRHVPIVLDIVGMPLEVGAGVEGVVAHGRVASLASFYREAHAAVVPILFGSGTRLKVVEAMAQGVPVVSTTLGAAGLPVRPGAHFLCGDDASTFAAALVELAERLTAHPDGLEPMLSAARGVAEELFWPRITDTLIAGYEGALAAAGRS